MKRTMIYMLAAVLLLGLLSGCGENLINKKTQPSASPKVSEAPATATPVPNEGTVKDEDGIITDNDSGTVTDNEAKNPVMTTENELRNQTAR